jgi:hypothetical protein
VSRPRLRAVSVENLTGAPASVSTVSSESQGSATRQTAEAEADQAKHLLELHDLGTYTQGELAELFGVGRSTVYRTIERMRPKPPEPQRPFAISRILRGEPTPADQPRRWASHRVRPASTPARHIEMSQLRNVNRRRLAARI